MNVQYAIKDGDIYVLEVNPRASRTVPFVAKAIGVPVAKIGALVMAGEPLAGFDLEAGELDHVAVKEAVFPFARFPNVDTLLGPEMRSTGEVMGLDRDFALAFAKSQLGAGGTRADSAARSSSRSRTATRPQIVEAVAAARAASASRIIATSGTQRFLDGRRASPAARINKVLEGRPHIVDAIKNGEVQLVFNTTEGAQALADSRSLRRAALLHKVPYYTTIAGAIAASLGIEALPGRAALKSGRCSPISQRRPDRLTGSDVRSGCSARAAIIGTASRGIPNARNSRSVVMMATGSSGRLRGRSRGDGKDSDDRCAAMRRWNPS